MYITELTGVGRVRASYLEAMDVYSTDDLLRLAPISYRDLSVVHSPLDYLEVGTYALVSAKVVKISKQFYSRKCKVVVKFENAKLSAVWFNAPYVTSVLKEGFEYLFYGKISKLKTGIAIVNPTVDDLSCPKKLKGIVPIYRASGGISSSFISSLISEALEVASMPYDLLSEVTGESAQQYYRMLHLPTSSEDIRLAREHFSTSSLLSTITAYRIKSRDKLCTRLHKYTHFDYQDILDKLPYSLTPSQIDAISDISSDLTMDRAMNRIVYGDVGSGKSIVAYISMSMAVRSGHNCALMCPTQILAEQHYHRLVSLFGEDKVRLVTASHHTRFDTLDTIGFRGYIVGTHALLRDLGIEDLAMVVIDEQQRFGVSQREYIENISSADTLLLTATPIPRTYMLALSGILDESRIERPLERKTIKTYLIPDEKVAGMYDFIIKNADEGRQTFIVCPRIYDEDGVEMNSVEGLYEQLRSLMGSRIAYVHGKMKATDKSRIISDYQSGAITVLLSTTVIEVGIDVKNAYIMLVMNAERYGLATLHQLRGRVGRGDVGGYCFLRLGEGASDSARERVNVLTRYSDGLTISRYDYEHRGGGDIFSIEQSGATAYDIPLDRLAEVRLLSDTILNDEELLHNYTINVLDKELSHIGGVTLD